MIYTRHDAEKRALTRSVKAKDSDLCPVEVGQRNILDYRFFVIKLGHSHHGVDDFIWINGHSRKLLKDICPARMRLSTGTKKRQPFAGCPHKASYIRCYFLKTLITAEKSSSPLPSLSACSYRLQAHDAAGRSRLSFFAWSRTSSSCSWTYFRARFLVKSPRAIVLPFEWNSGEATPPESRTSRILSTVKPIFSPNTILSDRAWISSA